MVTTPSGDVLALDAKSEFRFQCLDHVVVVEMRDLDRGGCQRRWKLSSLILLHRPG